MRKINTSDVFKLARIIKKAEMRDKIAKSIKEANEKKNNDATSQQIEEDVGIEVVLTCIEACANDGMEKSIYELLSGIAENSPEDIEKMTLEALIELVQKIVTENNVANFFNAAQKLTH